MIWPAVCDEKEGAALAYGGHTAYMGPGTAPEQAQRVGVSIAVAQGEVPAGMRWLIVGCRDTGWFGAHEVVLCILRLQTLRTASGSVRSY